MPLRPLSPSQRRVYDLLVKAGAKGVTTQDMILLRAGNRFSARLRELRAMPGCVIRSEQIGRSSFRYTLVSVPDVERGGGRGVPINNRGLAKPSTLSLSAEQRDELERWRSRGLSAPAERIKWPVVSGGQVALFEAESE